MQQLSRAQRAAATLGPGGQVRLDAGGYGYGLRVGQTCDFGHLVWHSGGLPGFGSLMRWLPEYGVGFIALGNRTYTGWGVVADQAFGLLAATGVLQPRVVQPSPALVAAKDTVSRLLESWDDRLIEAAAAANLFLDRSKERRRAELAALRGRLGACRADESFERVENALRGDWVLRCERGRARASVTLAPTLPPTIQYMEVREAPAKQGAPQGPSCPR
jgi:CubicO group peptidase (beta-lactamase class C family)